MKSILFLSLILLFLVAPTAMPAGAAVAASSDEVIELDWQDLVPKDFTLKNPLEELTQDQLSLIADGSPEAEQLQAQMERIRDQAPVVEALNDKIVRLPGFVVPLEFDDALVSEFLLVPYFGACIHVPPPPANQIVYVKSAQGFESEGLFSAVYVRGKLKTLKVSSELAEAGYTLEAYEITPYQ